MTTFERKSLPAAVMAGLGALAVAGTVEAVNVSQTGVGSALIYPYYTTRAKAGGNSTAYYDSYVSIVNTTAETKALRVRFWEGKRSAEVLSFNLFLSPRDVWTGAVTRTSDGAMLVSTDRSCVVPSGLFSAAPANALNRFSNANYATFPQDGGGTTLDRTREGFLEVLEMGVVTNVTAVSSATHNAAGVPANCAYFQANDSTLGAQMTPPTGGLKGGLSLINVQAGTDYRYDAIALADWTTTTQYSRIGSLTPNLATGNVLTSRIVRNDGSVVTSQWPSGIDAVSAALMARNISNEFVLETATASSTDWVVTFPTKFAYVVVDPAGPSNIAGPFNANFTNGQSCDFFGFQFWNREEQTPGPTGGQLCYGTNVITFANSNTLGSTNLINVDPTASSLSPTNRTGWGQLGFTQSPTGLQPRLQRLQTAIATVNGVAAAGGATHLGLPVLGFALQDFNNGVIGGVLSSYGGISMHRYLNTVTLP